MPTCGGVLAELQADLCVQKTHPNLCTKDFCVRKTSRQKHCKNSPCIRQGHIKRGRASLSGVQLIYSKHMYRHSAADPGPHVGKGTHARTTASHDWSLPLVPAFARWKPIGVTWKPGTVAQTWSPGRHNSNIHTPRARENMCLQRCKTKYSSSEDQSWGASPDANVNSFVQVRLKNREQCASKMYQ